MPPDRTDAQNAEHPVVTGPLFRGPAPPGDSDREQPVGTGRVSARNEGSSQPTAYQLSDAAASKPFLPVQVP
jgi:hypothetical protein